MNYKLKPALGYMLHDAVKQRLASWSFPKMWIKERWHAAEDPSKQKKRRYKSVLGLLPTGCVTFVQMFFVLKILFQTQISLMQPFTPTHSHYQNVQYTVILKAFSLTSKNIQGAYLLNVLSFLFF